MTSYRGIGLMSGTSLDGVDLAYCEFSEREGHWEFELLQADYIPFQKDWKSRLFGLMEASAEEYARTHVEFGALLGDCVAEFIAAHRLEPQFVGSHGQTIFHQPEKGFTAQIGCGETMASRLDIPVVTNFRAKDVAHGGQGAPLVPFGEMHLFGHERMYLNLGGFANISLNGLAFDVAPCNLVLNRLATEIDPLLRYDEGGRLSAQGEVQEALLHRLNGLPFYAQQPPKSLGAEWLHRNVDPLVTDSSIPAPDRLRTLTEHIAIQTQRAVGLLQGEGKALMVTGGGARNNFLMERLRIRLAEARVDLESTDERIGDYKEAIIFGFLALRCLLGQCNILRTVTGADRDVCGGSIHLPSGGWGKAWL